MDKRSRNRVEKYLNSGSSRKSKEGAVRIVKTLPDDRQKVLSKKHG